MRPLFGVTLLLSAALLFFVEPLFSRVQLPVYGGVPAVWSTCLVLFQATLLLGYLYAHLLARWLGLGQQVAVHLLLAWSGVALCWALGGVPRPPEGEPTLGLAVAFYSSIGLPFFVLAASTPLLQRWYSLPAHAGAARPYAFYAVSNLGSFVALLAYPLLAEPLLALRAQARLWIGGLVAGALLVSACGLVALVALRRRGPRPEGGEVGGGAEVAPSAGQRLRWLALSAVPSSLLIGATSHITTDVAAIPLLWVVPLAVYLVSFVLVFAERPPLPHRWMLAGQPLTVLPILAFFLVGAQTRLWIDLPLHLGALFFAAMVCHGELARAKPPASRLTEFYLWLAAGGCLGGVLTALVAPRIFDTVLEYPLMILAACLARPAGPRRHATLKVVVFLAALGVALLLLPAAWSAADRRTTLLIGALSLLIVSASGGLLLFQLLTTRRRVALVLGLLFGVSLLLSGSGRRVLHRSRSFFGTVRVAVSPDQRFHLMHHGTTLHGAQHRAASERRRPLTYFSRSGPLGEVFGEVLAARPRLEVAVAGLGVGTIAAYARPRDTITFYEIDAEVIGAASRAEWFSYLARCRGKARALLGDARVRIAEAREGAFDVIVQDAFSSDTIPVHLLTREALVLYLRKLKGDGLLLFNITNRHVEIAPQLAASLAAQRLVVLIRRDDGIDRVARRRRQVYPSTWVVAARRRELLAPLRGPERAWRPLSPRAGERVWTDDYAAILPYLKP